MATLTSTPDEVQALLALMQRTPLSRAEALFIEGLFDRWLHEVEVQSQGDQPAQPLTPLTSSTDASTSQQALPASQPSPKDADQV